MTIITLTHYERGPMRVRLSDEASWWERKPIWTDVNSDGALYEQGEFLETPEVIKAKIAENAP